MSSNYFYQHEMLTTYLVVSCNKLSHSLKSPRSRELAWTHHRLEFELLLGFCLRRLSSFLCVLLFLHPLPNWTRNSPVIDRYVASLTFLTVDFIMLTYMISAGRITPLEERFTLSIHLGKGFVIPVSSW